MDNFFKYTIRIIGCLCCVPIALFFWLYFFTEPPQTVGTTYVGSLTEIDPEETPLEDSTMFLELNMKKNTEGNGHELFEVLFTTYMGVPSADYNEKPSVQTGKYSKGVQFLDGIDYSFEAVRSKQKSNWSILGFQIIETGRYVWYDYNFNNAYYYDISYNNDEATSIASPQALHEDSEFVVGVGQGDSFEPVMLRFKNEVTLSYNYIDKYFGLDPSPSSNIVTELFNYKLISDGYLYNALYNTCKSMEQGTYYITIDLGEFFDVYLWDENTLQFDKLTADVQYTYVTCKINIDDNGITTRNESLFGMVAENDGTVSFPVDDQENKYWQVVNNVELDINDFNLRYSNLNNGYFLTIKNEVAKSLSSYKNLRIKINLELKNDDEILGFDSYGLYGIEIYEINIESETERDFYFLTNALVEVGDPIINQSENITIKNIDYKEVLT